MKTHIILFLEVRKLRKISNEQQKMSAPEEALRMPPGKASTLAPLVGQQLFHNTIAAFMDLSMHPSISQELSQTITVTNTQNKSLNNRYRSLINVVLSMVQLGNTGNLVLGKEKENTMFTQLLARRIQVFAYKTKTPGSYF